MTIKIIDSINFYDTCIHCNKPYKHHKSNWIHNNWNDEYIPDGLKEVRMRYSHAGCDMIEKRKRDLKLKLEWLLFQRNSNNKEIREAKKELKIYGL